jgi:carboxymethylenebutenolidase
VREELLDIARRIGTVGYCCMVPDFYYRQGRIRHQWRDSDNRMISLHKLDQERRRRVLAPLERLSDAMVVVDAAALLKFIDAQEPVRAGGVGAVGYCMGGRHVLRAAAAFPDRLCAAASLHGANLVSDQADSPHLDAGKLRGAFYCGFGERDPHAAPAIVAALDRVFASAGVAYRREVHAGAEHGYALPDRDIHDKRAAARDWELIFAMFRSRIQPG